MPTAFTWITDTIALSAHRRVVAEYGGADGLRDENLFRSALARPESIHSYSDDTPDIATLAAAYANGIIRNHPFVDGNKRTAWTVCRLFIKVNGSDIVADKAEKYQKIIELTTKRITEQEFAEWLRSRLKKQRKSKK